MAPLRIRFQPQSLGSRTRLQSGQWPANVQLAHRRGYAGVKEKFTTHPEETEPKGPNMEQAPHVSEEAAALSEIKGETGPDLSQGIPITEVGDLILQWVGHRDRRWTVLMGLEQVVKGDKAAQEKLPQVLKDALKQESQQPKPPTGSRSFSTYARRLVEQQGHSDSQEDFTQFLRQEAVEKEMFPTGAIE